MVMAWPVFEEYQPEMKSIGSKKNGKVLASGDGGIALTAVQFKSMEEVDVIGSTVSPPVRSSTSEQTTTTTHLTSVHVTCATTTSGTIDGSV